jgi:hypothetical protein
MASASKYGPMEQNMRVTGEAMLHLEEASSITLMEMSMMVTIPLSNLSRQLGK